MNPRLNLYLELERLMLVAENINERVADSIRDAMDPIWYELTDEDHRILDNRIVHSVRIAEGLRVPVSDRLYYSERPSEGKAIPEAPIRDWRDSEAA